MSDRTPDIAAIHDAIAIAVRPAEKAVLLGRALDAAVQKALGEQRERIAAAVEGLGCTCDIGQKVYKPGTCPIAIANCIRSGEIGGEQRKAARGEQK